MLPFFGDYGWPSARVRLAKKPTSPCADRFKDIVAPR